MITMLIIWEYKQEANNGVTNNTAMPIKGIEPYKSYVDDYLKCETQFSKWYFVSVNVDFN